MSEIRLYKGNCVEIMKSLPNNSIDLIVTDPPYELENHGGGGKSGFAANRKLNIINNHIDFISQGFDYDTVFSEFLRICKIPNILVFCSNDQVSKTMSWFENKGLRATLLVWHKTNACPLCNGKHISDVEFIVYVRGKGACFNTGTSLRHKSKVFTSPICSGRDRFHPTQKRVEHIEQYLELHSNEGDNILDCFMGSGTTGVSCVKLNRNFIGIEIDDKYFAIAEERIKNAQMEQTLF